MRRTWLELRRELTKTDFRDCVDYVEIDLLWDEWLDRLRRRLLDGSYRPQEPGRREAAKSNGAFRVITSPAIEDVLVYRTITDFVYQTARRSEPRGAFFGRRHVKEPVGTKIDRLSEEAYESFFEIWLRYDEYRKRLLRSGLYEFILITDISNFFESVPHGLLLEYLAAYRLPREARGILTQLIDVLRPASGHSAAPAIGLPVEQFDSSRTLAHIFLFEHDRRVVHFLGSEDAYVRWMDDQTIGVKSRVQARQVIGMLTRSLASQRLTLNAAKTKALAPADIAKHFWLDHNIKLNKLEGRLEAGEDPRSMQVDAADLWEKLKEQGTTGNWDKVALRILALAGRTGSDTITLDDCRWLLADAPDRSARVFEYLLARRRFSDYVALFEWFLVSENCLYEDVEANWFEALLRVSPPRDVRPQIKRLATEFVLGSPRGTKRSASRVPAAMLLYWIGDGRQGRLLESLLTRRGMLDGPTRRSVAAILCALWPEQLDRWLALAARQSSPQVSSLIEWLTRVREGEAFRPPAPLVFIKRPWVLQEYVYDARAWLRIELLAISPNTDLRVRLIEQAERMFWNPLRPTESVIVRRLERKLGVRFTPRPRRSGQRGETPGFAAMPLGTTF